MNLGINHSCEIVFLSYSSKNILIMTGKYSEIFQLVNIIIITLTQLVLQLFKILKKLKRLNQTYFSIYFTYHIPYFLQEKLLFLE